GRVEALLRDRRIIVEMDQIVRDPGMIWLAQEDRLEDCRALELIGVGLVPRRSPDVERDRVSDLRLVVVGVAGRDRLLGLEVSLYAAAMVDLVVVDVHVRQR